MADDSALRADVDSLRADVDDVKRQSRKIRRTVLDQKARVDEVERRALGHSSHLPPTRSLPPGRVGSPVPAAPPPPPAPAAARAFGGRASPVLCSPPPCPPLPQQQQDGTASNPLVTVKTSDSRWDYPSLQRWCNHETSKSVELVQHKVEGLGSEVLVSGNGKGMERMERSIWLGYLPTEFTVDPNRAESMLERWLTVHLATNIQLRSAQEERQATLRGMCMAAQRAALAEAAAVPPGYEDAATEMLAQPVFDLLAPNCAELSFADLMNSSHASSDLLDLSDATDAAIRKKAQEIGVSTSLWVGSHAADDAGAHRTAPHRPQEDHGERTVAGLPLKKVRARINSLRLCTNGRIDRARVVL